MHNYRLNNPEEDEHYFLSQDIDEHVQGDYTVGFIEHSKNTIRDSKHHSSGVSIPTNVATSPDRNTLYDEPVIVVG